MFTDCDCDHDKQPAQTCNDDFSVFDQLESCQNISFIIHMLRLYSKLVQLTDLSIFTLFWSL